MSKIKLDKSGRPFVIVNGGVYRPDIGPHESPIPQRNWVKGIRTQYGKGVEVKVRHISQSGLCTVTT